MGSKFKIFVAQKKLQFVEIERGKSFRLIEIKLFNKVIQFNLVQSHGSTNNQITLLI
jgi:hypothetical protein